MATRRAHGLRGGVPSTGGAFAVSDLEKVVKWLADTGFPDDWTTNVPAPRCLVYPLALEFSKRENNPDALRDYMLWLEDEQIFE